MISKVALSIAALSLVASPAVAAPTVAMPAKTFASCIAMNRVYKGGIAKKAGLKNRHFADRNKPLAKRRIVRSSYAPKVSASLYYANIDLDSDRDGIACER